MAEAGQVVILVYSTSHALYLEGLFSRAGIASRLIPVPRHLSSDCGVSLAVEKANLEDVRSMIAASGIEIQGLHEI
jgi:hypothetical protein